MAVTSERRRFNVLLRKLAQSLIAHINTELEDKKWRLKDPTWTSAYLEWKGGAHVDDPRIGKFRVVLANGKLFAKLDPPLEASDAVGRIWKIKDKAFPKKWYGLKVTVTPDGDYQCDFNYDQHCLGNPDFFNS
jgi:hypothetical protein